jgi:predicted dehydrogenase
MNISRKEFLYASLATATAIPLFGNTRAPLEKIRVGIIGLGMRGKNAVSRLSKIRDVEIVALCDLREEMVEFAQVTLREDQRPDAKAFSGTEDAWKKLVALDLDLVYIATPWRWHTPMAVHTMQNGKHAATEVPAATTLEECWELVDTSEKTGKQCMMLENCCYDFFELQTLNMVRQGAFGELTHAEGAYIHTLCELIAHEEGEEGRGYQGQWRFHQNNSKNGNLYPTHGLGPIAQCLNINRGNRFLHMVSMSSQQAAFTEWARENNRPQYAELEHYRGDMNTSLIKCAKGQTVMVQHDVSTPRPYSRIHLLQGTKGVACKYPEPRISLHDHTWLDEAAMKELEAKYEHPLSRTLSSVARKIGGHGGMDFIMDYRLIYCLKNGLSFDQSVYDAATWSCIVPLSIQSVAQNSDRMEIPDFTRGAWETNTPLGIVDVDPAKLPIAGI